MLSIIINPVSGGATPAEAEHRARIASAQLVASGQQGEVVLTARRGHGRELAQSAVREGHRLVIAWGGDGTVNEIASALIGTGTALGIVPAGSGNGLARELGVPRAAPAAIAAALAATPRRVDAGELGGRWFFSIAGVGFDAHVADAFDRDLTGRRGLSTYARITARELWRYRPGIVRIDGAAAISPLLIAFANSAQFGNGARIAPGARIDDGLLDLVVFEERSRLATMLELPRLFTGGAGRVRGLTIRQVTGAVVESDMPMVFHVDGEPVAGSTRLVARVHPGALLVCA
ncbi:MAG TPA: diacylglycerol kinase family protein [Vicinamibacterales bacterium]|nr:diacylglycerol kinase family protein [Vicinamibacterales bacterium]